MAWRWGADGIPLTRPRTGTRMRIRMMMTARHCADACIRSNDGWLEEVLCRLLQRLEVGGGLLVQQQFDLIQRLRRLPRVLRLDVVDRGVEGKVGDGDGIAAAHGLDRRGDIARLRLSGPRGDGAAGERVGLAGKGILCEMSFGSGRKNRACVALRGTPGWSRGEALSWSDFAVSWTDWAGRVMGEESFGGESCGFHNCEQAVLNLETIPPTLPPTNHMSICQAGSQTSDYTALRQSRISSPVRLEPVSNSGHDIAVHHGGFPILVEDSRPRVRGHGPPTESCPGAWWPRSHPGRRSH
nr:hypothetical protein CFP56_33549 [Quercus suber]